MISFCVFRRYGLAVPVLFFAMGLLLAFIVDKKHGEGYARNHLWTIGLNLLITGILTGIVSCFVNPPATSSGQYLPILQEGKPDLQRMRREVHERLQHFVKDESDEDMFCYIPLNRCAMGLMALGIIMILMASIHALQAASYSPGSS